MAGAKTSGAVSERTVRAQRVEDLLESVEIDCLPR